MLSPPLPSVQTHMPEIILTKGREPLTISDLMSLLYRLVGHVSKYLSYKTPEALLTGKYFEKVIAKNAHFESHQRLAFNMSIGHEIPATFYT